MEIYDVIDQLEEVVERAFQIPFIRKCLLDREDLMDLLADVRLKLPEDLKQAKWVREERTRIITEAHQEAANIIKDTEVKVAEMVNENEITKKAYDQANEIITGAQKNARDIRLGARQYAEDVLTVLEGSLTKQLEEIQAGKAELKK